MSMGTLSSPSTPGRVSALWPRFVARRVSYLQTGIVNVCFLSSEVDGEIRWSLVDTGLMGYSHQIQAAAEKLFGVQPPECILLTHGHFDHVGCVSTLADFWNVPVYAHPLESPYLIGHSPYPPPDPMVGGGVMASISWIYPTGPIDLGTRLHALPYDGTVPGMADWRWIHTPGHTPGHVSFYREQDRTLVAGDAFTTVKQESLLAVLFQKMEIHGPPAYFTSDWDSAARSVRELADLKLNIAITGHGRPLSGEKLRRSLEALSSHFDQRAVPKYGRYALQPSIADLNGVQFVPPDLPHPRMAFIGGLLTGLLLASLERRMNRGDPSCGAER